MAMKLLVDPPTLPRQAAGTSPNFPKNLEEAFANRFSQPGNRPTESRRRYAAG